MLLHAQHIQDAIDAIALSFSTSRDNAVSAVEKQTSELSETKKVLRQAYAALDDSIAKELAKKAEIIRGVSVLVETLDHVDMKRLRALALKTASKKSFCALFSTIDDTIYYVLSSNGIQHDMGELSKAVNLALGGKGGGRGSLAQGSSVKKNDFNETLDQLRHYFYQII